MRKAVRALLTFLVVCSVQQPLKAQTVDRSTPESAVTGYLMALASGDANLASRYINDRYIALVSFSDWAAGAKSFTEKMAAVKARLVKLSQGRKITGIKILSKDPSQSLSRISWKPLSQTRDLVPLDGVTRLLLEIAFDDGKSIRTYARTAARGGGGHLVASVNWLFGAGGYQRQNFGFNKCDVKWGALRKGVTERQMVLEAQTKSAKGYTYHPSLKFGQVLVGEYPMDCQSPSSQSWPLFLWEPDLLGEQPAVGASASKLKQNNDDAESGWEQVARMQNKLQYLAKAYHPVVSEQGDLYLYAPTIFINAFKSVPAKFYRVFPPDDLLEVAAYELAGVGLSVAPGLREFAGHWILGQDRTGVRQYTDMHYQHEKYKYSIGLGGILRLDGYRNLDFSELRSDGQPVQWTRIANKHHGQLVSTKDTVFIADVYSRPAKVYYTGWKSQPSGSLMPFQVFDAPELIRLVGTGDTPLVIKKDGVYQPKVIEDEFIGMRKIAEPPTGNSFIEQNQFVVQAGYLYATWFDHRSESVSVYRLKLEKNYDAANAAPDSVHPTVPIDIANDVISAFDYTVGNGIAYDRTSGTLFGYAYSLTIPDFFADSPAGLCGVVATETGFFGWSKESLYSISYAGSQTKDVALVEDGASLGCNNTWTVSNNGSRVLRYRSGKIEYSPNLGKDWVIREGLPKSEMLPYYNSELSAYVTYSGGWHSIDEKGRSTAKLAEYDVYGRPNWVEKAYHTKSTVYLQQWQGKEPIELLPKGTSRRRKITIERQAQLAFSQRPVLAAAFQKNEKDYVWLSELKGNRGKLGLVSIGGDSVGTFEEVTCHPDYHLALDGAVAFLFFSDSSSYGLLHRNNSAPCYSGPDLGGQDATKEVGTSAPVAQAVKQYGEPDLVEAFKNGQVTQVTDILAQGITISDAEVRKKISNDVFKTDN